MTREEAIDRVKRLNLNSVDREALYTIIPELRESNDERIRKILVELVKKYLVNHERCMAESWLERHKEPEDSGEISDGYHTFNELYYYRMLYNAAFFNLLPKEWVYKSKKHHDGEECFGGGWFIVMANLPTGQVSNHYELKDWDLFQIPEKEIADEWDGHTPQEAAERLYKYLQEKQKGQKRYWKPTEADVALFNKAITTNKALTPTERAQLDIIRTKFGYCSAINCSGIVQEEQKPIEWDERDENIRKQLTSICDEWLSGGYNARPCLNDVRWLKNLLETQKELIPAEWSEDDKDYYDTIVHKLEVIGDDSGLSDNQIKFLREHCPSHSSNWSEEDETIIEGACSALEIHGHNKLASKLKSIRPQLKQEWSEWDNEMFHCICDSLCHLRKLYETNEDKVSDYNTMLEWFRNRFKSLRHRPSWKPSEEQMEELNKVRTLNPSLDALYQQLKNM